MTRYSLPPGKKAFFLSDLHLGAKYFKSPREAELRIVRFLDSIADEAGLIFLVGDILDYWFEYRYVVPRGFVRFFGALARLSDAGVKIVWLIGNHDIWIFDYLPKELGITVVDGAVECLIEGKRFFITHGDDIDDSSKSFRFIRSVFRNRLCQRLFSAIHPRWTIPFALGWSSKSRHDGQRVGNQASPDRFIEFAKKRISATPDIDFFIFGHLHILLEGSILDKAKMVILGDWIEQFTYAIFDGNKLEILSYEQNN